MVVASLQFEQLSTQQVLDLYGLAIDQPSSVEKWTVQPFENGQVYVRDPRGERRGFEWGHFHPSWTIKHETDRAAVFAVGVMLKIADDPDNTERVACRF